MFGHRFFAARYFAARYFPPQTGGLSGLYYLPGTRDIRRAKVREEVLAEG